MAKKLHKGDALKKHAENLGVSIGGDKPISDHLPMMGNQPASEHELQRRVMEAENHQRQDRLWIVALVSAVAAVISSATALVALLFHR